MTDHKLIADLRDDTYFCDDPTDIHDRAADRLTELADERDDLARTNEALSTTAEAQREWAKVAELRITELEATLADMADCITGLQDSFEESQAIVERRGQTILDLEQRLGGKRRKVAELEAKLAAVREVRNLCRPPYVDARTMLGAVDAEPRPHPRRGGIVKITTWWLHHGDNSYEMRDAYDEAAFDEWCGVPDGYADTVKMFPEGREIEIVIPDSVIAERFASPTINGSVVKPER